MDNVLNLEKVFQNKIFSVPNYQRGYAWETAQCKDLMEDIELLPQNKDHYTGTLVLHPQITDVQGSTQKKPIVIEDIEGTHHVLCNVVDGQQRLTTIVILLYAIQDALGKSEDASLKALSEGIKKKYVSVNNPNEQPLYKLSLNSDCNDYFRNNVIVSTSSVQGPTIQSHQRLYDAKNYFVSYLETKKEELGMNFSAYLKELLCKITQHLKVSVYEVEDTEDVGVIFEVMNNRGKPLSELEKVKNYLLYLSSKLSLDSSELTSGINKAWAKIFEELMRSGLGGNDEDQLLRAHWLMAYDYDRRKWSGSKSIKARFNLRDYKERHKELLRDLMIYINGLSDSAVAYCDILKPMHSGSFSMFQGDMVLRNKLSHAGEKLRRIRVMAPFYPLLISVRLRMPQNGTAYLSILNLCEIFAFRVYRYMGKRSNAGQSSLFKFGYEIFNKERTLEDITYDVKWLINYYCSFKEWVDYFQPGDNWYDWYGIKYFLYEYEEHLAGNGAVRVPWDTIDSLDKEKSIEHILPQTPEKGSYWEETFSVNERKDYTHDIGNLSLTKDNSSYGRKPFNDKCGTPGSNNPSYANSSLAIERDICRFQKEYKDWNVTALKARREEIVKWALKRWYVEPIETKSTAKIIEDDADDIDGR